MQVGWKWSCVQMTYRFILTSNIMTNVFIIYHVGLASAPCILSKPQVLVTVNALTICIWVKLNILTNSVLYKIFKYNFTESQMSSDQPAKKGKNI